MRKSKTNLFYLFFQTRGVLICRLFCCLHPAIESIVCSMIVQVPYSCAYILVACFQNRSTIGRRTVETGGIIRTPTAFDIETAWLRLRDYSQNTAGCMCCMNSLMLHNRSIISISVSIWYSFHILTGNTSMFAKDINRTHCAINIWNEGHCKDTAWTFGEFSWYKIN